MKEDYPLFVHWYQTLNWILTTVQGFPRHVRFTLASRIADASLDTMELIVEAIYTKDRMHILKQINLRIERQRILFRIAHDQGYLSGKRYEYVARALDEAGKMVGGWKRRLNEKDRASF